MDNLNKLIFKAKGADTCPDGEVWTEKKEKKNIIRISVRHTTM